MRKLASSVKFREVLFLTTRNERNAVQSVSSLWVRPLWGINSDRVMTKTFAEGTDAVGSLGFVVFIPHICADGHMTTTLFNRNS